MFGDSTCLFGSLGRQPAVVKIELPESKLHFKEVLFVDQDQQKIKQLAL